ncbi:restriction endonuclease [bacterium]|nr:restriction endonuclease [bacterium]
MNYWTQLSVDFANQRNYLDELFRVYPTIPEGIREISESIWTEVENRFEKKDNTGLIKALLKLNLFPIKNSYVAYLREDKSAIERNPQTINRLCGRLYELGLDKIYKKCSESKETNRQMGNKFRQWLDKGCLGIKPVPLDEFSQSTDNAVLSGGDAELLKFAQNELGYKGNKGLDLIARFNGKYVIGEAKFLTSPGGNQDKSILDAATALSTTGTKAVAVAILDGVLYIPRKTRMFRAVTADNSKYIIMSALVLREFLYQI